MKDSLTTSPVVHDSKHERIYQLILRFADLANQIEIAKEKKSPELVRLEKDYDNATGDWWEYRNMLGEEFLLCLRMAIELHRPALEFHLLTLLAPAIAEAISLATQSGVNR